MSYYYPRVDDIFLKITFENKGSQEEKISVQDLSNFLYDFSLLYDFVVISTLPQFKDFNFTPFFYYRNGRPVPDEYKLYINKINQNSPLTLEVIIPLVAGAMGIPWVLVQAIEKIRNWDLNREKLKLEIEKLRLEVREKQRKDFNDANNLNELLQNDNQRKTLQRIVTRIEQKPLNGIDIEITSKGNEY